MELTNLDVPLDHLKIENHNISLPQTSRISHIYNGQKNIVLISCIDSVSYDPIRKAIKFRLVLSPNNFYLPTSSYELRTKQQRYSQCIEEKHVLIWTIFTYDEGFYVREPYHKSTKYFY